MGRGLLLWRYLTSRGHLSRRAPQSSPTNAVLATLSGCCPPPKGRLPTCYSPVRRCTQGRSPFLARLACVRPAANVRSEPGSNSPLILLLRSSRTSAVDDVSSDFIPTRLCRARRRGSSESGFACWHKTHNSSRYSVFKDRLLALASRGYYLYRRNLSTPVQPSAFGVPPGAVALEGAGFYHVGREREGLFRFFFALSLAALRLSSTSRWAWKDLNFRPRAYQARALTS
jgi:hypothetical protein